ncbi:MAG TPA: GNAT family protein [Hyphomicrobiaceae bacterium]
MHLTPLKPEELPILRRWMEDPALFRLVHLEPVDLSRPWFVWMIRTEDGRPVGWIDLFHVDWQNLRAEVGIGIPDPRGKGLSLFAARALRRIVFDEWMLHRVTARVRASNEPVIRLLKAVGFEQEGTERQALRTRDGWEDLLIFGILNPKSDDESG